MTKSFSRSPRAAMLTFTALASGAFGFVATAAMAQDAAPEPQLVEADISGDPAITMDDGRTVIIAGGVTVTGTGDQRTLQPNPAFQGDSGPILTTRTQGGVEFVGGTNGTLIVQDGATVIGENYGVVTDDLTIVRSGTSVEDTMTVENHGTIIGKADDGVRIFNRTVITNTGTIIGARDLPDVTGPNSVGSLGDGISHATLGVHNIEDFDSPYLLVVDNSGDIDARRMGIIGSGGSYIVNSGTIHGDVSGVLLQNTPVSGGVNVVLRPIANGYLENSGTITATYQNGASVWSTQGEDESFSIDVAAIDAEDYDYFDTYDVASADAVILNSGLIETFATAGSATTGYVFNPVTGEQEPVAGQSLFYAAQMLSTNGYILNTETGIIRAENGANGLRLIARQGNVENGESGVIVLDNQGTIIGSIVGANVTVVNGEESETAGQEIIRNNGLIDGDVSLGAGDDVFVLDADGHVTGAIDLGDGDDLMVWDTKASVGGFVSGGEGDNTLALILGGDGFDAAAVFNFGTVETYGVGDLNDIDLTYVPEIQVNEGASLNIGTTNFSGTAYVNTGGTLAGVGQVEAIVVRGRATLSPGNSIGTILVTGDVDLSAAPDVIYNVELSDVGSDQVLADGEVILAGGTINVMGENGVDLAPGEGLDSYVVLEGAMGLTGTFDDFNENLRFYDATVVYTGTQVVVELEPVGADFKAAAFTDTEASIGAVLYDALLAADGDFLDVMKTSFPGLNTDGVRAGLNTLSGPAHAWAPVAVSELGVQVGRLANRHDGSDAASRGVWAAGLASSLDLDGTGGSVGADMDVQGGAFGFNTGLDGFGSVGVFAGYASVEGDDTVGGALDADGWFFGGRVSTLLAGMQLNAHVGYLNQEASTSRDIDIGGLSRTATADYDVSGHFYGAELAWLRPVSDAFSAGVFGSVNGGSYEGDGYTETGAGSVSLSSEGTDYRRTSFRLGARVIGDMGWVRPRLEAGLQFEDGDRFDVVSQRLAGVADTFQTRGPAVETEAPFVVVGADFGLSEAISASVGYEGVFGDTSDSQGFTARINFRF